MNILTMELKRLSRSIRRVKPKAVENEGVKTCTLCRQPKPLNEFYFKATRDRYSSRCKSCHKEIVYAGRNQKSPNSVKDM